MVVCGKSLLVLWYRRMSLGRFLFKYRLSSSWIFLIFTVFSFCETCWFPVKLDATRGFVGAWKSKWKIRENLATNFHFFRYQRLRPYQSECTTQFRSWITKNREIITRTLSCILDCVLMAIVSVLALSSFFFEVKTWLIDRKKMDFNLVSSVNFYSLECSFH